MNENLNGFEQFGIIAIMAFIIWQVYKMHKSGGLKALFERSKNAPQHWNTFGILMIGVILLVIILIKL